MVDFEAIDVVGSTQQILAPPKSVSPFGCHD